LQHKGRPNSHSFDGYDLDAPKVAAELELLFNKPALTLNGPTITNKEKSLITLTPGVPREEIILHDS
jgi:hypothetical protein